MRRLPRVLVLTITAVLLTGCATPSGSAIDGADAAPHASASPSVSASALSKPEPRDLPAAAEIDSWLAGAVMPEGAVRQNAAPQASFLSYQGWPCAPMELRTGYWTLDGAGLAETANWLTTHPTADLMAPLSATYTDDPQSQELIVSQVRDYGSLEGIAYTVARTDTGVAIRAEMGVFTKDTVCPTPPGGGVWGSPGMG